MSNGQTRDFEVDAADPGVDHHRHPDGTGSDLVHGAVKGQKREIPVGAKKML